MLTIQNANGLKFNVVVEESGQYGRIVKIYDDRFKEDGFDPIRGQLVSSYMIRTLRTHPADTGLNLQGDVPDWKVDADQMTRVLDYIKDK